MTHYEVFKNANRNELAFLLATLVGGALGVEEPEEILELQAQLLDFLGQDANC